MTEAIPRALYLFGSDIVDEGLDRVLNAAADLQASTLAIAFSYHQARDLMPHGGAKPRLRYRRDGIFFTPSEKVWRGSRVRPQLQPPAEIAAVEQLMTAQHAFTVEAWTVFLHNTSLGEALPELTTVTCFGDHLLSNLCPSNTDVSDYAAALANDVSARGVDVIAEALSGQTFAHGHHHERSFTPIGDGDEALLALCFCEHCVVAAQDANIDAESLSSRVRTRVQRVFSGAAPLPAGIDPMSEAVGPDLAAYLRIREESVTAVSKRVGDAVRENGQRLSFMDLTGAVLGYGDGNPVGPNAADQAWRISINPATIAPQADSYSILGYVRDAERLAQDIASYKAAIGDTPLRVILRPGYPDTNSATHLQEKVAAAVHAGADQIDFYNYGMYDSAVLARIAAETPPKNL